MRKITISKLRVTNVPAQAICQLCTLSNLGVLCIDLSMNIYSVYLTMWATGHINMPHGGGQAYTHCLQTHRDNHISNRRSWTSHWNGFTMKVPQGCEI